MSSYEPYFSLQGSQPYSLTHDFMNGRWTPSGTYWVQQPHFIYRTGYNENVNENKVNNNNNTINILPKKKYLYYDNKYN
tara:strand:+ start:3113 stop:3349 length:237 start_codon:yes stop_codon:yes gene_type:complete